MEILKRIVLTTINGNEKYVFKHTKNTDGEDVSVTDHMKHAKVAAHYGESFTEDYIYKFLFTAMLSIERNNEGSMKEIYESLQKIGEANLLDSLGGVSL